MATIAQIVSDNQYNPVGIQSGILDELVRASKGEITIVDTTNPVAFILNSATQLLAAGLEKNEANTRKQYPSVSQTPEDLYHHMTDRDYINRFAMPSRTTITVAVTMLELATKFVLDPMTGIKKVVIPRNTVFKVANTTYSLQYPIEIRQMMHGGYDVIYDTDIKSPLLSLDSNLLSWFQSNHGGVDWMVIDIDVMQFDIITLYETVSSATAFNLDVAFDDLFYYARVYAQQSNGSWKELPVTFSAEIYDITKPMATLTLVNKVLNVNIPSIYTTTGLLRGQIRVDLYQTQGSNTLNLSSYPPEAFSAEWLAIDNADSTIFVAPIRNMQTIKIFSNSTSTGGRNSLSFEVLRDRVIDHNIGPQVIPITQAQIMAATQDTGYDIVPNIDNLTSRVFLATRTLPMPQSASLVTPASLGMGTLTTTFKSLLKASTVIDNGSSITITPDTIYEMNGGILDMMSDDKKKMYLAMSPDQLALAVTNNNTYYSPFYYVLDASNVDELAVRPYHLDNPMVLGKTFISSNDATMLNVAVDSFNLQLTPSSYQLLVGVSSNQEYKDLSDDEVFAQLSFISVGERERVYLNGTLVGTDPDTKERMFSFDLASNMNVKADNSLQLKRFKMYSMDDILTNTPLTGTFDIVFGTTIQMGPQWSYNEVDAMLCRFMLPSRVYGIVHEALTLQFGHALDKLWSRACTLIDPAQYEKYQKDVPATYPQDIYDVDPVTGSAVSFGPNGEIITKILHKKGDPVIDQYGNIQMKHLVGDTIVDPATNRPVIAAPRSITQQLLVLLVEGAYWFATDTASVAYRNSITDTLISWMTTDLNEIQPRLLDQCKVYFYPKACLGDLEVMVGAGLRTRIQATQSFQVALYLNSDVYGNEKLKKQLETTTIAVLNSALDGKVVAISDILSNLREKYGDDVIDVSITGLGGAANYPVITVMDGAARLSIRKLLAVQGDSSLAVEEDITFIYVKHDNP